MQGIKIGWQVTPYGASERSIELDTRNFSGQEIRKGSQRVAMTLLGFSKISANWPGNNVIIMK